MKTVSARQANHEFSDLLSRVERGEEILITKRSKPVAVLSPYRSPLMTAERKKAIQHAIDVMSKGLPWGDALQRFNRDEMHRRRWSASTRIFLFMRPLRYLMWGW
jgi:prevent-host-death family protein